jgi:hypothetical protein
VFSDWQVAIQAQQDSWLLTRVKRSDRQGIQPALLRMIDMTRPTSMSCTLAFLGMGSSSIFLYFSGMMKDIVLPVQIDCATELPLLLMICS